MFTKKDIIQIAKAQLALDYNCQVSDFNADKNTIVENKLLDGRRIYDSDGCLLKILCFGRVIISAAPELMPWCEEKFVNRIPEWFFIFPRLRIIDNKLQEFGHQIADVHHYYLPNPNTTEVKPITDVKWYETEDIMQFKNDDSFEEAFAFDEKRPDVLAVAAFDGDKIMGMAGASADSETMWQIGIDVLPEYRGSGIGTNLVTLLKNEILKRGKVPFYGTVESHFPSQNTAINAGFSPAWAELYSEEKR